MASVGATWLRRSARDRLRRLCGPGASARPDQRATPRSRLPADRGPAALRAHRWSTSSSGCTAGDGGTRASPSWGARLAQPRSDRWSRSRPSTAPRSSGTAPGPLGFPRSFWPIELLLSMAILGGVRFGIRAAADGVAPAAGTQAIGSPADAAVRRRRCRGAGGPLRDRDIRAQASGRSGSWMTTRTWPAASSPACRCSGARRDRSHGRGQARAPRCC